MRYSNEFANQVIGGGQTVPSSAEKAEKTTLLNRIAACLYRWYSLSRERRQLAEMSDHMLKDIGLSRADAEQESARYFWDDPR